MTPGPPEGASPESLLFDLTVYCTVTLASANRMFGRLLAWMIVVPDATAFTGTTTVLALAGIVTVDGTLVTPGLSELRFTVNPPTGARPDSASVSLAWIDVGIARVAGLKLRVSVTSTENFWREERDPPEQQNQLSMTFE